MSPPSVSKQSKHRVMDFNEIKILENVMYVQLSCHFDVH